MKFTTGLQDLSQISIVKKLRMQQQKENLKNYQKNSI